MRSSKSRSRSKSNRNRPSGNIVNRVFDSSGPEGKVRGTPQQIIDKYNQLARDAQLSNDRVAAENFQQHAEHYLRMLGEAQREQEARREQQERQNAERQADQARHAEGNGRMNGEVAEGTRSNGLGEGRQPERGQTEREASDKPQSDQDQSAQTRADRDTNPLDAVLGGENDGGLVETPEEGGPRRRSRPRRARAEKSAEAGSADAAE